MSADAGPGLIDADSATPASEEAEVSVLGAMLIDAEARHSALEHLEDPDFHHEGRRRIFAAFARLNGRGQDGGVATLADELKASGDLEAAGGMETLAQLVDAVDAPAKHATWIRQLREKRVLRDLQEVARDALRRAERVGPGQGPGVLADVADHLREIEGRLEASQGSGLLRTAREILDDPDARTRPAVVANLLAYLEQVLLFAGREKLGKSTLLRWTAARVSAGLRVWGEDPVPDGPRDVLYYGQERPVDIAADLQRMGADLSRVHVRDMRTMAGDRFAALRRDLEEADPALLVVDTLSTFTDRMDLDPGSSSDWEPVMHRFGALAQEAGVAVVLSHHARKSDGEYRDSTAIGAGVDAILELRAQPSEGEKVRKVTAKARSAVPARDFSYTLAGTDHRPRLELLDGSLSLEERVQRFVADHEGCSQRAVLDGVRGQRDDVRDALKELCRDGGPLVEDDSSTPYQYRTADNPRGNGTGTGQERQRNGGTDGGGRSVPDDPEAPVRGPGRGTQAGSVGTDGEPRRCACGNKIGFTAMTCGACRKRREEVRDRLPDPDDVVQVGETYPTTEPIRMDGGLG